jgi:molecular chaperone HscA
MPAGLPKVEVGFLINADGILTVSAKEIRSGVEQHIEVRPQYGLSDTDVEKMLMDSITHAKEDIAARALAEARTEADQLLKTTERFLNKNANLLSKEELLQTAAAMQALQLAISMDDKDLIHTKNEALNDISRPYAERIMDEAVSKAMSGKKV